MSTTFLSKKGFKELQKEISGLEISEKALTLELKEIGRAKSRDDKLRRNDVITQLENVQSKIFMKKDILRHAKPLPRKRDRLKIAIGSVVDLVDQQGKIFRYTLVHSLEANPLDGRISVDSPLGKSLLNHKKSETVSWKNGLMTRQLQVVKIS